MKDKTGVTDRLAELGAAGTRLRLDLSVGHIRDLWFAQADGRVIEPLHTAPWVGRRISFPAEVPEVDRKLSGDFLCAPFGPGAAGEPGHGWSANSEWQIEDSVDDRSLDLALVREIRGARLTKRLSLSGDAPLLYQRHWIDGGSSILPVAHHTMIRMRNGGRLCFSSKLFAATPDVPLNGDAHLLAYPAYSAEPSAFPGAGGDPVSLTEYPAGHPCEDLAILVENPENPVGWTAVMRNAEQDIVVVLKRPVELPMTMLWFSNGGRTEAPWNGRHCGVIGIEDGYPGKIRTGRLARRLSRVGVPEGLQLSNDTYHCVHQVIGAVSRPAGWEAVSAITLEERTLVLHEPGGDNISLPFDPKLFGLQGNAA